MNEANVKLVEAFEPNYMEVLPLFIDGDEVASRSIYPQMDRVIEKTSNMIDRHSMVIKGKEKNKWIDENWVLMAQAYYLKRDYFKAEELLLYVKRKYKKSEERFLANIWLGRTHVAMEKYGKVEANFKQLEEDKAFPDELKGFFYMSWADYLLKIDENRKAIQKLEESIKFIEDKKDKVRPTFILAQLYQFEGFSIQSIRAYNKVIKLRPKDYEMEFYAQINQALAFRRRDGDSEAIKKQLEKMLKDEKNLEYNDQIYYALADIYLEERKRNEGMDLLNKSIRASIKNVRQKGLSYLRLADLYFDDREYELAQAYYDSTSTTLPNDFPNFEEIKAKGDNLTDLVDNLDVVTLQDSLQELGKLDSLSLVTQLELVRENLIKEEENKARKAREEIERAQKKSISDEDTRGKWYFYNNQTMQIGYNDYLKKWGDRTLEDNWRRKNKATTFDNFEELNSEQQDSLLNQKDDSNIPTVESMVAMIPVTEVDYATSDELIAEALYNAGVVYKEKLNDLDNAIESFEVLINRFDTSDYTPVSYYQLYRIYITKQESGNYSVLPGEKSDSDSYKDYILKNFPNSDYALLILNPEWNGETQLMLEQEAYLEIFKLYKMGSYPKVIIATNKVLKAEPENNFLPEYHFMKALTIGNLGDGDNYIKTLVQIVGTYPGTEEAERAQVLLGYLNQEVAEPIVADSLTTDSILTDPIKDEIEEFPYKITDTDEHYFALIYPNKKGNVNDMKVAISKFNNEFFKIENLRITNSFINKENQIVIVRKFDDKAKGLDYRKAFNENQTQLSKINETGYQTFIVSRQNFTTLFKQKDPEQYQRFFELNYKD